MTESVGSESSQLDPLPDDLPPVEPPSAKILAQLFLVPGVIVLAIAVAWLLVTRLASSDQDWRALVRGVETNNEHQRWRSAFGLAQLLQSDASAPAEEQKLVVNPELAGTLGKMFQEELKQPVKSKDDVDKRVFLAGTLGLFKTPDVVLPALREGLKDEDKEVRNAALRSMSGVLGNSMTQGKPVEDPATLEAVIGASGEADPLVRNMATYTLGLLPLSGTQGRLETLLTDENENVRANAAVALVRNKSLLAVPQLKKMLEQGTGGGAPTSEAPATGGTEKPGEEAVSAEDVAFSRRLQVLNGMTAVGKLADVLPAEEKQSFTTIVEKLAAEDADPTVRVQAVDLLTTLKGK